MTKSNQLETREKLYGDRYHCEYEVWPDSGHHGSFGPK